MTHCPSCGAPYKPNSQVCEYCGTVREKLPDEIRMEQELEQTRVDVEQAKQEFLTLRLQAAQRAQHDNIKFNLGNGNVVVNSTIGVNNKVERYSDCGIDTVNAGNGAVVFMGAVNGVKNIQATCKIKTQKRESGKSEQADELTEAKAGQGKKPVEAVCNNEQKLTPKEILRVLAPSILAVVVMVTTHICALHTGNETISTVFAVIFFVALLYLVYVCFIVFMCLLLAVMGVREAEDV